MCKSQSVNHLKAQFFLGFTYYMTFPSSEPFSSFPLWAVTSVAGCRTQRWKRQDLITCLHEKLL